MKWLLLSMLTVRTFTPFMLSLMVGLCLVSVDTCVGDLEVSIGELAKANRPLEERGAASAYDRLIEAA